METNLFLPLKVLTGIDEVETRKNEFNRRRRMIRFLFVCRLVGSGLKSV